jgi:hypothetical protein
MGYMFVYDDVFDGSFAELEYLCCRHNGGMFPRCWCLQSETRLAGVSFTTIAGMFKEDAKLSSSNLPFNTRLGHDNVTDAQ